MRVIRSYRRWISCSINQFFFIPYLNQSLLGEDVLRCYTDREIDRVVHDYVGVEDRNFPRKKISRMRPGQVAIAFKQYITPSETQPILDLDGGAQAQKIENIYIYCEIITRMT